MDLVKPILAKLALLSVTGLLCLLGAEFAIRQVVDPVDFLRPSLVPDSVLRWRVEPHSAGHDAWGYRNAEVPDRADIVTVGDSQTYGHGAPASGSWPAWLSTISGRSVYNLALGGYGPVDYRALVERRIQDLSPSTVVVGLYFGNDLMDAWRSAYTMDHWASLRDPDWQGRNEAAAPPGSFERVAGKRARSPVAAVKQFLGEHSVLYRMAGLALSDLIYGYAVERSEGADPDVEVVRDGQGEFVTGLNAPRRLRELDLDDPRISEGLRIALDSLGRIRDACRESGIDLLVLLIPTKISVFEDYQSASRSAEAQATIRRLADNEREVRGRVESWLDENGIAHVSPLDRLRGQIDEARIYPRSDDGHPTSVGYRVLAESVADRIQASGADGNRRTDASAARR